MSVWGDIKADLPQIASLCSDELFTKLSSRFKEKRNLAVFKNGKPRAI